MNKELSIIEKDTGNTPEERALLWRVRVWVNLRWLVIVGIIIATIISTQILDITFPTTPVYIICAFIVLYNLFFLTEVKKLQIKDTRNIIKRARINGNLQVLIDMVTMTILLHYTGGVENPFVFFYLVHTTAAAILLPIRRAYELSTLAIVMCSLLFFLEYYEVISHVNLQGFVLPTRFQEIDRVLGILVSLTALIYSCTYLSTAVSGELRRRQRAIVALRDQLIETRTNEVQQITAQVSKLEEERKRFTQFLGVVAHDLQAPLVATQSIMTYMVDGYTGQITESQKDLLERAIHRIDGLLAFITSLLDIPRIATGQMNREMQEISLNEVIQHSIEGLDNLMKIKGLTLTLELPQNSIIIFGAKNKLQQVVTNLVSNAINYTQEGYILLRVKDNDNEVCVEVIDSGIGISAEDLPQLFNDFFRGSNVGSKGSGLGLSISKRIIEAHGGRIWAESPDTESQKGSRFTFTLPKKPKA